MHMDTNTTYAVKNVSATAARLSLTWGDAAISKALFFARYHAAGSAARKFWGLVIESIEDANA
jgi:hypothetical protein